MEERKRRRQREEAFTLIEIMVVIMIIGLLVGVVGINVMNSYRKAERKAAAAQISNFEAALDTYRMDCGRYPSPDQGLAALAQSPGGGSPCRNYPPGGYLKGKLPNDPWGNPYVFMSPGPNGEVYSVESYGADGMDGGEGENADIESWNLSETQ
jgi:general secretion pathway protein G